MFHIYSKCSWSDLYVDIYLGGIGILLSLIHEQGAYRGERVAMLRGALAGSLAGGALGGVCGGASAARSGSKRRHGSNG